MAKHKALVILTLVVLVAALLAFLLWRDRIAGDRRLIRVSGNIEITAAQLSFKIQGRVNRRLVTEGESVTNGQLVALLEKTEWEQEAAMRRADARAAQAVLDELLAGSRPEEIQQAAAGLEIAVAESKRMSLEFARQKELLQQKFISQSDFDATEAASSIATAKVRDGEARLELLKKGPREETIAAARARLEQARQAVALAETRLGYATLTAPMSGIVLSKEIENGEYVVPGTPVVTVGDIINVWLRAYLDESDLGRVKLGQTVKVATDTTYPGKNYTGRLSFIASEAEFTPKNVQTARERVKLVYRIKVDIFNPNQELKPGMPADAEIESR